MSDRIEVYVNGVKLLDTGAGTAPAPNPAPSPIQPPVYTTPTGLSISRGGKVQMTTGPDPAELVVNLLADGAAVRLELGNIYAGEGMSVDGVPGSPLDGAMNLPEGVYTLRVRLGASQNGFLWFRP